MAESNLLEVEIGGPDERARRESRQWAEQKVARTEEALNKLVAISERRKEILALPDSSLVAGVERWYSASEAAAFFGRTPAWMYDRLAKGKFTYKDGTPIRPKMVGEGPKPRMRFNLDIIAQIALSMHRDGTVKIKELKVIRRRVQEAEFEEDVYDPDDE